MKKWRIVSINNAAHTILLINDKGHRLEFTVPPEHRELTKKIAYIEVRKTQHYKKIWLKRILTALITTLVLLKVVHFG